MTRFDVIVIGAGHAGCEAAWAAARLGCRTGIFTVSADTVAKMPCNPAIGGTAKGHLVAEIDALGGLMGRAIDATGIQFKLLNRSRGPAVRSPRAQADKAAYGAWMKRALDDEPLISWVIGKVGRILTRSGRVCGVALEEGDTFLGEAVVITTGTFLNGLVHVGDERQPAGRRGEPPATALAESVQSLGFEMGRLKTGTPPRVHRRSVDVAGALARGEFEEEPGDDPIVPFSFMSGDLQVDQVSCYLTWTTERVRELVLAHAASSPLLNGRIRGIGPRYCPSLEDKIVRFPTRERHQVFLEPEGRHVDEVYVNGLSMSLPRHVQEQIVRAMPGLHEAEILQYGYAVEYDFVQPTELGPTLETERVEGLFLAGQINGTSGYEEAGAQGLFAGINAAARVRRASPLALRRDEAYIGVMVDDLISTGCLEPYRIFTSRAEFRLLLRVDNADLRLTEKGRQVGLVDDRRWARFEERRNRFHRNVNAVRTGWVREVGGRTPASQVIRRPGASLRHLHETGDVELEVSAETGRLDVDSVETVVRYEGYLRRQEAQVARGRDREAHAIPDWVAFDGIPGLSTEARQRLTQMRPRTLGQASRVPGVTPAAVALVAAHVERGPNQDQAFRVAAKRL